MRPESTLDSVIQTALDRSEPMVRGHLEAALEIAEKFDEPLAMREAFDDLYCARDVIFDMARIHENVAKAIAIFFAARGDFRKTTLASVNFGRDTDCLAASACGLCGAFAGASAIPAEWIALVEKGTRENPYTCSNRGMKETADGIYAAYENRVAKMRRFASYFEAHR
jgi:ADP-ribosylglycohydrolase